MLLPHAPARRPGRRRRASWCCWRTRTGRDGIGARSTRARRSLGRGHAAGPAGPVPACRRPSRPCTPRRPTPTATDWPQIAALYGALVRIDAVARGRAEPRGGRGDGRRPRCGPGADRPPGSTSASWTATTCCIRPAPTCFAGWAGGDAARARTAGRSDWPRTPSTGRSSNAAWPRSRPLRVMLEARARRFSLPSRPAAGARAPRRAPPPELDLRQAVVQVVVVRLHVEVPWPDRLNRITFASPDSRAARPRRSRRGWRGAAPAPGRTPASGRTARRPRTPGSACTPVASMWPC